MRAAVVHGQDDIRLEEVSRPIPEREEVLVRVRGAGVCATDVKILGGAAAPRQLPTILGHEVAGIIAEIGQDVTNLSVGQRVAVYPIAACGSCFFCKQEKHNLCLEERGLGQGLDGGFAEYVLIPGRIVRLGGIVDIGDMPYDLAAMIEPTSCCLAAAEQCGTKDGDNVVVIGCGPLGLLHTIISIANGARVIALDVNPDRLSIAAELGADVINTAKKDPHSEVMSLTAVGADVVIAALGIPRLMESYFSLVRSGGVFNIFGGTPRGETIILDPRWLHYGEITLTGTFASSLSHFNEAHLFVRNQAERISRIISDQCRLDGILDAVQRVKIGQGTKSIVVFE
ncbi:MAG: zinc-binding alcohol dehydrogenase [Gemmatimonadetes bacterium]|nr:zinc-binding alcohol dehydrogenase [Gemmatimonadota bacterium]